MPYLKYHPLITFLLFVTLHHSPDSLLTDVANRRGEKTASSSRYSPKVHAIHLRNDTGLILALIAISVFTANLVSLLTDAQKCSLNESRRDHSRNCPFSRMLSVL